MRDPPFPCRATVPAFLSGGLFRVRVLSYAEHTLQGIYTMVRSFVAAALAVQLIAGSVAAEPQRESEKAADPSSKVICKRFTETGSLVRSYKMCKTKLDWQRSRDDLRQSSATTSCRNLGSGGSCS